MLEIILSVLSLGLSCYACFRNARPGPQGLPGLQGPQGLPGPQGESGALNPDLTRRRVSKSENTEPKQRFITKDERRDIIRRKEFDPETLEESSQIREKLQKGSGLISLDPASQTCHVEWRAQFIKGE